MKEDKIPILKVLVGSRAHDLADENSDYDYRAVYVTPTSEILSLGFKYKGSDWIEGDEDNTSYEIGHFLHLATKCNPSILEVFQAPIITATKEGFQLQELFPYVWNTNDAFNAFVGYGVNQRKKFLDKKDNRQNKYAVAYIRVLYQLIQLLDVGDFKIAVDNKRGLRETLLRFKAGSYTPGEVIDLSESLLHEAQILREKCSHVANLDKINHFLLDIRKKYWLTKTKEKRNENSGN